MVGSGNEAAPRGASRRGEEWFDYRKRNATPPSGHRCSADKHCTSCDNKPCRRERAGADASGAITPIVTAEAAGGPSQGGQTRRRTLSQPTLSIARPPASTALVGAGVTADHRPMTQAVIVVVRVCRRRAGAWDRSGARTGHRRQLLRSRTCKPDRSMLTIRPIWRPLTRRRTPREFSSSATAPPPASAAPAPTAV